VRVRVRVRVRGRVVLRSAAGDSEGQFVSPPNFYWDLSVTSRSPDRCWKAL